MESVNWFEIWMYKALAEMLFPIVIIALMGVIYLIFCIPSVLKVWRCKHERFFERGGNCHDICRDCSKDLGFRGGAR